MAAVTKNDLKLESVNAITFTPQATGFTAAGGNTSKTLTVSGDATISETPPLNANVLKGDGTAGRVLRAIQVIIQNGTTGVSLKCTTTSLWNGDINGAQDDIAKNATTGVWSLSNNGLILTLLNTGISGDAVAVISSNLSANGTTSAFYWSVTVNSGIAISVSNSSGTGLDLTTLVDTGAMYFDIAYLTTA